MVSRSFLLIAAILFLTSCKDDSTGNFQTLALDFTGVWQGGYTDTVRNDSGTFVVEISQNKDAVRGELVMKSFTSNKTADLFIKGTVSGTHLAVSLDSASIPYRFEFILQASLTDSQHLSGNFRYFADSLNAVFRIRKLHKGNITVIDSIDIKPSVRSITCSAGQLWVSTLDNYFILTTQPAIVDSLIVLIDIGSVTDLRWTSGTLASNGTVLWGDLPSSISNGPDFSHILKFSKQGVVLKTFDIPHRTNGLAFDGRNLWSLNVFQNTADCFDTTGVFTGRIPIRVPDAIHLEHTPDSCFWCLGWYLKELYKVGIDGNIRSVYDLPKGILNYYPVGIAFDGTHFWYSRENSTVAGYGSIIYKLLVV